jgi:hypothetical protein
MNALKRLGSSYASVAATAALVLALGMGGAYAAGKIGAKKIATGAISSKHIKDGQVMTADLARDVEVGFARTAGNADRADTARTAASANTADSATTATRATTANTANAVAANAVSSAGIADGSVAGADLGNDSINSAKLQDDSVNGSEIVDGSVNSADLTQNSISDYHLQDTSVTGPTLGNIKTVVGPGTAISVGNPGVASVECPAPMVLLAGGFAWQDEEATSIIYSAPSEGDGRRVWLVKGLVPAGSNTLYAWANCLMG